MKNKHIKYQTASKQQGAVLAISLIMLLVMTLLGISGLQGTTIEEKMAGNLLDKIRSFEAAESALREGEKQLAAATAPSVSANAWLHEANKAADGDPHYQSTTTLTSASTSADYSGALGNASQPSYIVELLPAIKENDGGLESDVPPAKSSLYRVTAYGEGKTDKAITIVQSIYHR